MKLPENLPPPMPAVAAAQIPMRDVVRAAERGVQAWNKAQMEDAIRSIEFFIDRTKAVLAEQGKPTAG